MFEETPWCTPWTSPNRRRHLWHNGHSRNTGDQDNSCPDTKSPLKSYAAEECGCHDGAYCSNDILASESCPICRRLAGVEALIEIQSRRTVKHSVPQGGQDSLSENEMPDLSAEGGDCKSNA